MSFKKLDVYGLLTSAMIFMMMYTMIAVSMMFPHMDIRPATIECLEHRSDNQPGMCKAKMEVFGLDSWRIESKDSEIYKLFSNTEKNCIANNYSTPDCYRMAQEKPIIDRLYQDYDSNYHYLKAHDYPTLSKIGECFIKYSTEFDLSCMVISSRYGTPSLRS